MMRTFDLSPLYRTSIGFDHLANMLDNIPGVENDSGNYPPFNIELIDDNKYRLSMAVAGFAQDEINIEVKENVLRVQGQKKSDTEKAEFLHRGIATRNFERRFQLADHVVVQDAQMSNGLLHVDMVRELPEAMKPRTIAITTRNDKPPMLKNEAA